MRAMLAAWFALTSARVHADPLELRVERETHDGTPLLSLDPIILGKLEGLTGEAKRTTTPVAIGRTQVILEGVESANVDKPERVAKDLVTRGWRAGIRVGRRVGSVRFEAGAALGYVQTPSLMFTDVGLPSGESYARQSAFSQGTYYEVGVTATKRFTLLDHAAWLSLSGSRRVWLGNAPLDEPKTGFQLMLTFGLTF